MSLELTSQESIVQESIVQESIVQETNSKPDNSKELKTLKYKTMGLRKDGVSWPEGQSASDLVNLDKFLEDEKKTNSIEPWSKLDKTAKLKKLLIFASIFKDENNLSNEEYNNLITFLRDCLDRKKLYKVKDVIYDKDTGLVKDIPGLYHSKPTNHFTLKNIDKKISVTRSLAPKKVRGTAKNITTNTDSEEES
jgi:hypothetical protein